ncbi:MAG: hypothetical protein MUF50_05020 [Planctomycetes bacterium]|nr:hypothetical protein [Planctomycetota bacterium]
MNFESPNFDNKDSNFIPVPLEDLKFDNQKAKSWIEAETDLDIKAIKTKIIENIQHITFAEFQVNAQQVIAEATTELANKNQKYALLFDYKPHSSKRWMYEINKNCFTENPPAIASYFTPSWEKMSGNDRLRRMIENDINTFLICDDGAYSGEQIVNRLIDPIIKFYETEGLKQKPKFVLAIPFVTNRFLKLVDDIKTKYGCEVETHISLVMPTLAEILSLEEKEILNQKRNGALELNKDEPAYLGATLTYFDHRVADDHSFSGEVQSVLELSANKPYSDERSEYFITEDDEFRTYKNTIYSDEIGKKN